MNRFVLLLLLVVSLPAFSQIGVNPKGDEHGTLRTVGPPMGYMCAEDTEGQLSIDVTTSVVSVCGEDFTWHEVQSGGQAGLSSFTVDDLEPVFTATLGSAPTTAPVLTFTLNPTGQSFVMIGPNTGPGLPTYRTLSALDLPTLPYQPIGSYPTFSTSTPSVLPMWDATITGKLIPSGMTSDGTNITAANFIGAINGVSIVDGAPSVGNVLVATGPNTAQWNNNIPTGTGVYHVTNGTLDATAYTLKAADIPTTLTSSTSGNAATATAFNHTPVVCPTTGDVPEAAAGINADGSAAGCFIPSGTGAPGSVVSVSAGNLAPLFTTAVTNSATTPAIAFTPIAQVAHTFFGNNTDADALPDFEPIGLADLPTALTGAQAAGSVYAGPSTAAGSPVFRQLVATDIPTSPESGVTGLTTDLATITTNVALKAPLSAPSFNGNVFAGGVSPHNFSTPDGGYCFGAVSVNAAPIICLWSDNATNVHFGDATKSDPSNISLTAANFIGNLIGTSTGVAGSQPPNSFYAGPASGTTNAAATFRPIASADFPANPIFQGNATVTGNLVLPTGSVSVPSGSVSSLGGFVSLGGSVFTAGLFTTPTALTFTNGNCLFSVGTNNSAFTVNASTVTTAQVCPISLNTAAFGAGQVVTITKIDANALVTLSIHDLVGQINGQSSYLLTQQWQSVTLHSDGTNWEVVAQNNPNITSSQPANYVLAAPSGASGLLAPRLLQQADVPFTAGLSLNNAFTGNNTVPTQAATDNSTKIANTAQVQSAIAANMIFGRITIASGSGVGNDSSHTNITVNSDCVATPITNASITAGAYQFSVNVSASNIAIDTLVSLTETQVYAYMCKP